MPWTASIKTTELKLTWHSNATHGWSIPKFHHPIGYGCWDTYHSLILGFEVLAHFHLPLQSPVPATDPSSNGAETRRPARWHTRLVDTKVSLPYRRRLPRNISFFDFGFWSACPFSAITTVASPSRWPFKQWGWNLQTYQTTHSSGWYQSFTAWIIFWTVVSNPRWAFELFLAQ